MKRTLSLALLIASMVASAQIKFAVKSNLLFKTDSPSWQNIKNSATDAYSNSGKNNVGYNVGLSAKVNLASSLFVMPELYYTSFKTEFDVPAENVTIAAKNDRIDLPVLLGYKILGENMALFAGPVASYNLATENEFQDFKENGTKEFTVGYQLGAQIKLQQFIVTGKYEGAFTEDQRDFISSQTQEVIRYDSRPSLFIVGLGYQF